MARGINDCTFIGNLGAKPDLRYTQTGTAVANFNIAVTESWTKDGEKQERTEWVHCVAWAKLAEICDKFLTKGQQVYVRGKLQTRKWQDRDGNDRTTPEIVVSTMQMLGGQREHDPNVDAPHPEPSDQDAGAMTDDDIPF